MSINFKNVGDKLIIVGKNQRSIGSNLRSNGTRTIEIANKIKKGSNVYKAVNTVIEGVYDTRELVKSIASTLTSIVNFMYLLKIKPHIVPNKVYIKFLKLSVVIGFTLEWENPFMDIINNLKKVIDSLHSIRDSLLDIKDNIKTVRDELPVISTLIRHAGKDMYEAGGDMNDSGKACESAGKMLTR